MQPTNNNNFRNLRLIGAIMSFALLVLHFYFYCYAAFTEWELTASIPDRLATNLAHSGLFRHRVVSKLVALFFLALTLIGSSSARTMPRRKLIKILITGLFLYLGSDIILLLTADAPTLASLYILITLTGLYFLYSGAAVIAALLYARFAGDIFNRYNESFPQEERHLTNPHSINLRARYTFRNQVRNSWVSIIDVFRHTLIAGTPGSGKTRFIFRQFIQQSLANQMAIFVYDLKYDDLTRLTYNTLQQLKKSHQASTANPTKPNAGPNPGPIAKRPASPNAALPAEHPFISFVKRSTKRLGTLFYNQSAWPYLNRFAKPTPGPFFQPDFFSVNFVDPSRSHQLNAIPPESLDDVSDAAESSRTILYALNKRWIHQSGEFFVESAINFFTANIWFLRQYENGRYCTLPHLIELIHIEYDKLFSVLNSISGCQTLIGSFISAYTNNTMEQLQGQVDSARIPLSALSSPTLYYILSGNDFTLDINNPAAPKVVCIGSDPKKQHVYGAVISLYISRMIKLVNRKGGIPCHLIFDEFPSIYADSMDVTLASARSNKVAVTLGIQDLSQLKKTYGRDQADALFNLPGNLISGQVSGDSARQISERFGRILQEKSTISTNSRDSSTSQSLQLDLALPPSKISTLSSGEFVGIVADSPTQSMPLKAFHAKMIIDNEAIAKEEAAYKPIPEVRHVTREIVELNFRQIKAEVHTLVEARLQYMHNTPSLARLIVAKNDGFHQRKQSL